MADYPNGSNVTAITFTNTSSFTLALANQNRLGATITNNGTGTLYVLLGTGTASSTLNTVAIPTGTYYEVPFTYRGAIQAAWSATGSGTICEFMRV